METEGGKPMNEDRSGQKAATEVVSSIRDRIVELRRVPAKDLRSNPNNWRTHDERQRAALEGMINEVGFAGAVLAYEENGELVIIDGHLRQEVADDAEVPVLVTDLTRDEADRVLATFVAPIFAVTIQRGPARMRKFNPMLAGRADTDFVLRALLKDRIVLQDRRFFFDMGAIFAGRGGNVDIVTEDEFNAATQRVAERWAGYVTLDKPSNARHPNAKRANKVGVQIRVSRRSQITTGSNE